MDVALAVLETQLGWIGIAISDRGIVSLQLPRPTQRPRLARIVRCISQCISTDDGSEAMVRELRDYAKGECRAFDLPVDLSTARPFQRQVLAAISHIPFGETRSYGWVARAIGKPGAARAVGQALHTIQFRLSYHAIGSSLATAVWAVTEAVCL